MTFTHEIRYVNKPLVAERIWNKLNPYLPIKEGITGCSIFNLLSKDDWSVTVDFLYEKEHSEMHYVRHNTKPDIGRALGFTNRIFNANSDFQQMQILLENSNTKSITEAFRKQGLSLSRYKNSDYNHPLMEHPEDAVWVMHYTSNLSPRIKISGVGANTREYYESFIGINLLNPKSKNKLKSVLHDLLSKEIRC